MVKRRNPRSFGRKAVERKQGIAQRMKTRSMTALEAKEDRKVKVHKLQKKEAIKNIHDYLTDDFHIIKIFSFLDVCTLTKIQSVSSMWKKLSTICIHNKYNINRAKPK